MCLQHGSVLTVWSAAALRYIATPPCQCVDARPTSPRIDVVVVVVVVEVVVEVVVVVVVEEVVVVVRAGLFAFWLVGSRPGNLRTMDLHHWTVATRMAVLI